MHHSGRPSWIWPVAIAAWMAFALTASASDRDQVTEEFHRTVPLSADGRVSLHNINGGVTITGWERNEVQIDAVKSADSQQKLEEASIEVESSSSSVEIRTKYPAGRTEISSVNGAVHAFYRSLENVKEVRLKSVNGSVNLGLPSSPNADVSVSTVNGGITTDFPLTEQGKFMSHHIDGKLGNGGTRIELHNVNGSVHIGNNSGAL